MAGTLDEASTSLFASIFRHHGRRRFGPTFDKEDHLGKTTWARPPGRREQSLGFGRINHRCYASRSCSLTKGATWVP